jgi:hypothetical protein
MVELIAVLEGQASEAKGGTHDTEPLENPMPNGEIQDSGGQRYDQGGLLLTGNGWRKAGSACLA